MENNNFCDNQCFKCLGYDKCIKSFKKKDRFNDNDEKEIVNENVLIDDDNDDEEEQWWQK